MCARRFLFVIFILTLLAVAAAFAVFQWGGTVLRQQFTPQGEFIAPPASSGPDYSQAANWIARPGLADDPSSWRPDDWPATSASRAAHTFYIHPTTYLAGDRWNGPIDTNADTSFRTRIFVQSQASAFADVSQVWAPRYRQAAYGAFLLSSENADKALGLAYADVSAAFDQFLKQVPAGEPLILAGHSQGALHLMRLLRERKAALQGRLAAAYVVGWPISRTADLPSLGFPACSSPAQSGCILSWMSFGDPANPSLILEGWEKNPGPGGPRRAQDILCVNPISGTEGSAAAAADNPGTLIPTRDLASAELVTGAVGARCEDGLLKLDGERPSMGPYLLPGNNYHVYDYALFWGGNRPRRDAKDEGLDQPLITASSAEFAAAAGSGGKLVGLDVGTKTIGLAICDRDWSFAGPVETLRRTKFTADLERIRVLAAREAAVGLVVGLPLNMDGSDSPRTQSVRAFARNLAALSLPILLWDERWSTQAVQRAMIDADVSRAKRAQAVDKLAAAHILQGAIDSLANLPPPA